MPDLPREVPKAPLTSLISTFVSVLLSGCLPASAKLKQVLVAKQLIELIHLNGVG